ncbi:hypothetical protein ACLB2K_016839 [Fragaria x ananassa]
MWYLTITVQLTRFAFLYKNQLKVKSKLRLSHLYCLSLCFDRNHKHSDINLEIPKGKTYLRMKTGSVANDLINADFKDLAAAAKKLANHAVHLGSLGFGTTFLEWVASFAAMYATLLCFTIFRRIQFMVSVS